jgi:hypothetical protein
MSSGAKRCIRGDGVNSRLNTGYNFDLSCVSIFQKGRSRESTGRASSSCGLYGPPGLAFRITYLSLLMRLQFRDYSVLAVQLYE